MSQERFLYGVPDAEWLGRYPEEVWESEIEPYVDYVDDAHRSWVIEKWTVADNRRFAIDPMWLLEQIGEWGADEMGLEEGSDAWERVAHDPKIQSMAQRLIHEYADRVQYWSADEKVGEHIVTLDDEGAPLLDGRPMYVKSTVAGEATL